MYLLRPKIYIGLHVYVSVLDLYCSKGVEILSHKTYGKTALDQKEMYKATNVHAKFLQPRLSLCDPVDCSLPVSSLH